jgi:hypothetical protein
MKLRCNKDELFLLRLMLSAEIAIVPKLTKSLMKLIDEVNLHVRSEIPTTVTINFPNYLISTIYWKAMRYYNDVRNYGIQLIQFSTEPKTKLVGYQCIDVSRRWYYFAQKLI